MEGLSKPWEELGGLQALLVPMSDDSLERSLVLEWPEELTILQGWSDDTSGVSGLQIHKRLGTTCSSQSQQPAVVFMTGFWNMFV